jgi:chaperone modulatory protein CbpM
MDAMQIEAAWPEMGDTVGFTDLALACAMSVDDVRELIEFGALLPLQSSEPEPVFDITCMEHLRTAGKIRRDYDLDLFVVVIVLDYLRRIDALESQLRTLQASIRRASPRSSAQPD